MDLCYSCMCTLCLWFGMCWKFLIRTNLFTVNAVTRGGSQYCLGTCLPKWSLGYLLHRLVIHSACSCQHNFNVCQCSCISTVSRLLVAQWKLSQCQAHLNRMCHLREKKKNCACSRTNDQWSYVTMKTHAVLVWMVSWESTSFPHFVEGSHQRITSSINFQRALDIKNKLILYFFNACLSVFWLHILFFSSTAYSPPSIFFCFFFFSLNLLPLFFLFTPLLCCYWQVCLRLYSSLKRIFTGLPLELNVILIIMPFSLNVFFSCCACCWHFIHYNTSFKYSGRSSHSVVCHGKCVQQYIFLTYKTFSDTFR